MNYIPPTDNTEANSWLDDEPSSETNNEKGLTPDAIKRDAERLLQISTANRENMGILKVKPAKQWVKEASLRPVPKMLFSEFWFEGEICILFADTNLGKSILAVQIGNSISLGQPIPGFKLECKKQPVLYFDFELTDKQFENRYSVNYDRHYPWDENMLRVEINPDGEIPGDETFEQYLNRCIEGAVNRFGAKVLIIDNLTYLRNETEKAKEALPLMKELQALKKKYNLSIMALAHTPKRDQTRPITGNDLQGSKMLMNFCDSALAMGISHADNSLRYLKQIKQRNTENIYGADNICVCQINKPFNFLQFNFLNYGTEGEHLKQYSDEDRKQRTAEAIELRKQGKTYAEIALRYGVTEGAVRKWFRKNEIN